VRECLHDGYQIAKDPLYETFAGVDPSGKHTIAALGATEMVLMEIPEAEFNRRQMEISQKSADNANGVEEEVADRMRAGGAVVRRPGKRDGLKWESLGSEE
jgi:hypothetical protein